jgi:hypothetical protein
MYFFLKKNNNKLTGGALRLWRLVVDEQIESNSIAAAPSADHARKQTHVACDAIHARAEDIARDVHRVLRCVCKTR